VNRVQLTNAGWLGKTFAGLLLGLVIALAASGLFAWFGPGGIMGGAGKTQFNMWLVAPIWSLTLSLVYLFRTTLDAWKWLGAIALLMIIVLYLGKAFIAGEPS